MSEAGETEAKPNRLWEFVNSGFGLWLLSTLAVSGGATVFQIWTDYRDDQAAQVESLDRLHYEVAGRLSQYLGWLEANLEIEKPGPNGKLVHDFAPGTTREKVHESLETLADAPRRSNPRIVEIFPEFRERSFISLLGELIRMGDEDMVKPLRFLLEDEHEKVPDPLDYATFRKRFSDAMILEDIDQFGLPFTKCFDC